VFIGVERPRPSYARLQEVKAWVREAWGLPEDAPLMVSELACSEPGCPPVETVIAVLRPKLKPVQRKLFSPVDGLERAQVLALPRPPELDEVG
jgi:hypothetical protein